MRILVALFLATLPVVASAQDAEVPTAVSTFAKLCLAGGIDPAARPIALSEAGWVRSSDGYIDVPKLSISKAIERNYDFSKPQTTDNWSGTIDGRDAKIVLASFAAKNRYPNICALTIEDIKNAMPYGGELRAAFKEFGIGGKSVDLVHYFEFAGKVGPEKHPVRGEVFTRSFTTGGKNTMHIYIAY